MQSHRGKIECQYRIAQQVMADQALYRESAAMLEREGIEHDALQILATKLIET